MDTSRKSFNHCSEFSLPWISKNRIIDALEIQESLNWIEEAKKEYKRNHEPAFQYILKDNLFFLFCDHKATKQKEKLANRKKK